MNCTKLGPMADYSVPGPIMDRIGDIDPITHGGGVIFQTSHGPYLEFTDGTDNREEDKDPTTLEVFRTHIERDVAAQFNLEIDDIHDLCEELEYDFNTWLGNARDPDPARRARCIVDIADFLGWEEIDEEPLVLGEVELHLRWHNRFGSAGAVTTRGCFRPEVIVPEMLQTLKSVHAQTYWELFKMPFPIVPSEALIDPDHHWWEQHGNEAVNKLIETLKRICPPDYVFEVREETFGFWRKQ